jgi:hypothetical protein
VRQLALQAAAQYIEEHNLQKVVEDAINATIKAKPSEPFAFMVRAGQHPLVLWSLENNCQACVV